jgi:hypothetical protein
MRFSDIPFNPPTRTLRWFAALLALFLANLALWQMLVHDRMWLAGLLLGLALAAGLLGWLAPRRLRPVLVGWMVLVFPLGWISTHLLLVGVHSCIFSPVGLFFRLIGRDVLARGFPGEQESYWVEKPAAGDVRRYFRQS